MKSTSDEEEELFSSSQKELRRQANQSIQQLSSTLQPHHSEEKEEEPGQGLKGSPGSNAHDLHPPMNGDKIAWNQKAQSEAVNQLKSLLLKQGIETTSVPSLSTKLSPSKKQDKSSIHHSNDLVPMSHNQSEYIQHLEAEVKLCKDELQGMKQRINVVVVENEKLQAELRSKAAEESLRDYTLKNSMVNETANSHTAEHTKWKNELEHLKVIHEAHTETLELQVLSLRKDLSFSQRDCEELKVRLSQKEKEAAEALRAGGAPPVAGLCLTCAQQHAVSADSQTNQHVQTISKLKKDYDELLAALCAAKASQQEAQQKERAACLQVKQAVQMVEEAKLCKAKTELQCEQMSRELAQRRQQSEQEHQALLKRLNEARDEGRTEALKQKEELAYTVAKLSRDVAELEGQLDRAQRDKQSLTKQLEETLYKLSSQDQARNKVCSDLRYQLSQAQMKKDDCERELRELHTKTDREMEKAKQEVERLSLELVGCRQQLEAVQKDGSQWQAKAISLEEQLASAQHQLHLTRQKVANAERSLNEELASVTLSAQKKQRELALLLEQTEAGNQQRVSELESLLSSQNSLIGKLRKECSTLVSKLEELTENTRGVLRQADLERQHLEKTVKSLRERCSSLEDQCVQHGHVQQKMRTRLQQLDRHCQSSAQQVCELLAKRNQLSQLQEREVFFPEELRDLHVEVQGNSFHTLPP